jgi:hypothetical protein
MGRGGERARERERERESLSGKRGRGRRREEERGRDWFRVWGVKQKHKTNKSVLGSEHG